MKSLSVMQPWAWLLVNGYKDIENRDWRSTHPGLRFRGKVLIHAGLKIDRGFDYEWAESITRHHILHGKVLPCGGIVGMVEIMDCVTDHPSPWFFGPYGFVIGRARPLPFMPLKGQLGFFDVEYDKSLLTPTPESDRVNP